MENTIIIINNNKLLKKILLHIPPEKLKNIQTERGENKKEKEVSPILQPVNALFSFLGQFLYKDHFVLLSIIRCLTAFFYLP